MLETLPHERIRELQLKKFKSLFRWTYDHSRFHRELYDKAGVTPEDIQEIAYDVLRHRLILNFEAEAEGVTADKVIGELISRIAVP